MDVMCGVVYWGFPSWTNEQTKERRSLDCALGQLTWFSARGVPNAYADTLAGNTVRMQVVVANRDDEPTSARLLTRAGNRNRVRIANWVTQTRDKVCPAQQEGRHGGIRSDMKGTMAHDAGDPLARSWLRNMSARAGLSTCGSRTMENLPTKFERGGSAANSSTSSSHHWYSGTMMRGGVKGTGAGRGVPPDNCEVPVGWSRPLER